MDAANIVDVVSDFVTLKRAGANLKGLCPFHDDRTPSFIVSPAKNYCKCFSCGKGGNPVGFIMEHEQLTYPEALRYLARKYGIEIEEKKLTDDEIQSRNDRESMFIVNEWARDWFTRELYETPNGRSIGLAYFRGRGFRDDILRKFQVGYCPNIHGHSLSEDALKEGFKEKYLTNTPDDKDPKKSIGTGLCFKNQDGRLRDRFFARVIWPIFTISGRVAGFGGRVLDSATKGVNIKYQNSPESIIYSKRKELFGLYQAKEAIRKRDMCYLVEGYTDVMAMHQAGVENVVASSGTALTHEQIRFIHRMTDNITVIYDGDEAGIHASERGIDMLLSEGMNVKLLLLPDGEDPDSFARKHSSEEFQEYLQSHLSDFIHYKTAHLMEQAKDDPVRMGELINSIVESISVIPDEIKRVLYTKQAAQTLHIEETILNNAVRTQLDKQQEEKRKQLAREYRQGENESTEDHVKQILPDKENTVIPIRQEQTTEHMLRHEKQLTEMIVRYGQKPFCCVEDEQGNELVLSVAEYVHYNLMEDNMTLQDARCRRILEECMTHVHDEGFEAERYFLNHADMSLSNLAFELSTDTETVSKFLDTKETGTSSRLADILPAMVAALKLEAIHGVMKELIKQISSKEVSADKARQKDLLQEYSKMQKRASELAKQCDRVILI